MTFKKYLVLLAIVCFGSTGDTLLARGMRDVGEVHLSNWTHAITAIFNPWIACGIVCLIIFFGSYLASLSWADLTFVLPATAFGYVVTAFLSRVFLHETVSPWRWAGVLLITCGVGLVARGPSLTERHTKDPALGKDSSRAKHTPLTEDAKLAKDSALATKEQHELA